MIEAEKKHRAHAVVEQVISDLKGSALTHLPRASSPPTAPGSPEPSSPKKSPAHSAFSPGDPPPASGNRHHPSTTDQHSGAQRQTRTKNHIASAPLVAMGTGLDQHLGQTHTDLSHAPTPTTRNPGKPERPAEPPRPERHVTAEDQKILGGAINPAQRWIEGKSAARGPRSHRRTVTTRPRVRSSDRDDVADGLRATVDRPYPAIARPLIWGEAH